jgi:hypothetical protein
MRTASPVLALVLTCAMPAGAQQKAPPAPAQDKPPAAAASPAQGPKPLVPLKVQIVLSRYKGDKKIGSLPYMIGVAANERGPSGLRMGIEVPIARRGTSGANYRSVGTNIDVHAESAHDGYYKMLIAVEDSSVHQEPGTPGGAAPEAAPMADDYPAFRTFKTNFTSLLRDGQSTQYTSAVDPISGEVMRVDVTLNVLK